MKTLRYILLLFIFICPVLKAQDIPAWYRTTTELNIRKKPSVHSPIIYRVPKGEEMIAIGVVGDWFQVVYRKDTLYASSRYLEFSMFTDDEIEEEPQPQYKERSSWSFSFLGNCLVACQDGDTSFRHLQSFKVAHLWSCNPLYDSARSIQGRFHSFPYH